LKTPAVPLKLPFVMEGCLRPVECLSYVEGCLRPVECLSYVEGCLRPVECLSYVEGCLVLVEERPFKGRVNIPEHLGFSP